MTSLPFEDAVGDVISADSSLSRSNGTARDAEEAEEPKEDALLRMEFVNPAKHGAVGRG